MQHDVLSTGGKNRVRPDLDSLALIHYSPHQRARTGRRLASAEPGRTWPPRTPPPASIVPVPALGQARSLFRPHHNVRRPRLDLLFAAWASVRLRFSGAWDAPHHPAAVRPVFHVSRTDLLLMAACILVGGLALLTWRHGPASPPQAVRHGVWQPARLPRAHERISMAATLPPGRISP